MHYHDITKNDMKNGDGLRVVLWVSGCDHRCPGCQNPLTWDPEDGLEFDEAAYREIAEELEQDYVSGLTLSGGDPLYAGNRQDVLALLARVTREYPDKSVWLYTGYTWDEIELNQEMLGIMEFVDVLVDGTFRKELLDVNYPWAGSTNQRVIDVAETMKEGTVVLYANY